MKKQEIINVNQFVWMLFTIITSITTLQIPGLLIYHVGRDAWLSVIIAWFLDVLLAIVYAYMGLRFPGQNFVQYSMTILGKYLGKVIGITFPLFFLMVTAVLMRSIAMLVTTLLMPDIPIEIISLCGYIFIAYAVKKGVEVLARVSELLGPIYLISFIILFLFLAPDIRINELRPLLVNDFYYIFSGSLFILTFIGMCIMMGMYIPICNHMEKGFMAKFIAVSLGASIICFLVIFSVCAFGLEQAKSMFNPGLMLSRIIMIGNLIGRVEAIWFIVAIDAGLMTSASLIWASSLGLSQIIGLKDYKSIVYPVTLISAVLGMISFENNNQISRFSILSYPFIGLTIEVGLELFLFIMAFILKKDGRNTKK